jgi:hypothetical protein
MTSTWKKLPRLRVDPYLNWRARELPAKDAEKAVPWCLVRVELPETEMLTALERLKSALDDQHMPDDPTDMGPTILASNNEMERIGALIEDQKRPSNARALTAPERQFYIYRPETLIYRAGQFRISDLFVILQAGPPIAK